MYWKAITCFLIKIVEASMSFVIVVFVVTTNAGCFASHRATVLEPIPSGYSTNAIVISTDGKKLIVPHPKGVAWLDASTGVLLDTWNAPTGEDYRCLSLSKNNDYLAAASWDGIVTVWKVSDPEKSVATPQVPEDDSFMAVLLLNDDHTIVTGSTEGKLLLWDRSNGQKIAELGAHPWAIRSLAQSPKGEFVFSASMYSDVSMWDVRTQKLVKSFNSFDRFVQTLAVSPDGRMLATGDNQGTIHIWNIDDQSLIVKLTVPDSVYRVVFNSTGTQLIAAVGRPKLIFNTTGHIHIWDVAKWRKRASFAAHEGFICSLTIAPQSGTIFSVGHHRTLMAHDLP